MKQSTKSSLALCFVRCALLSCLCLFSLRFPVLYLLRSSVPLFAVLSVSRSQALFVFICCSSWFLSLSLSVPFFCLRLALSLSLFCLCLSFSTCLSCLSLVCLTLSFSTYLSSLSASCLRRYVHPRLPCSFQFSSVSSDKTQRSMVRTSSPLAAFQQRHCQVRQRLQPPAQ